MGLKLKFWIFLFLLWFVVHEIAIITDGLSDDCQKAEVAVVFGNKVNEDGSLSERLKARLDRSLVLYKDSLVSII